MTIVAGIAEFERTFISNRTTHGSLAAATHPGELAHETAEAPAEPALLCRGSLRRRAIGRGAGGILPLRGAGLAVDVVPAETVILADVLNSYHRRGDRAYHVLYCAFQVACHPGGTAGGA